VVSVWEVFLLAKRGRLELPVPAPACVERAIAHRGLVEVSLTRRVIARAVDLPDLHQAPLDRILVAETQERGLVLPTRNPQTARYPHLRVLR
jgi:PIN domain nuclease of toxin-antitoxin system